MSVNESQKAAYPKREGFCRQVLQGLRLQATQPRETVEDLGTQQREKEQRPLQSHLERSGFGPGF